MFIKAKSNIYIGSLTPHCILPNYHGKRQLKRPDDVISTYLTPDKRNRHE
jgi:hypothetical protein